uniref:Protein kinase domain-containing protein n=1 Tax=Quercus lobata TaxID=97700 RepID=A0A7N2R064_QUELO
MFGQVQRRKPQNQTSKSPLMAILYVFLFIFIFLSNPHRINSRTCKLNFSQFPYEAQSECFDIAANSVPSSVMKACCGLALQSLFKAMAIEANHSGSIFLQLAEAKDCSNTFQNLHQSSNLAKCELQDLISSSTAELCSSTIDAIISFLGIERYNAFRSNCTNLYASNYSDETCFNCVMSYRQSLQALRKVKEHLLDSKELLATVIVAAVLVILAPLLYILTRRQIQYANEKDLKNLSAVVFKKEPEDEAKRPLNCSDLYIFSPDEMAKATDSFNNSNLIGEGTLGKMYVGIMPSGMKAAIKRLNEGIELHNFIDEIFWKAKIRHPNLVSTVGCCDRGDECLVYEYCVNGDLSSWLLGDKRTVILTWERRMQIFIGIARGLWFLHTNPLEKLVHGDIMLANILLTEKLEPKISDPILSNYKLKKTETMETTANDVFNFGVVLLQLLTGRKPESLVKEARNAIMKGGSISAMADPCLNGAYIVTEFQNVLSIAVQCNVPKQQELPQKHCRPLDLNLTSP